MNTAIEQAILVKLRDCNLLTTIRLTPSGLAEAADLGKTQALARMAPPWALLSLSEDRLLSQWPHPRRELVWEARVGISALATDRAGKEAGQVIDGLRNLLSGWQPLLDGELMAGVEPAQVSLLRCEGVRNSILLWLLRISLTIYPQVSDG